MSMKIDKKVIIPITSITIVILIALGLWFTLGNGTPSELHGMQFSKKTYTSIEEMVTASDAIIIGKVMGITGHEIDYGGADANLINTAGIPLVFYQLEVEKTIKGNVEKNIIVASLDTEVINLTESATPLKEGQRLMLFLNERTNENAPGIRTYDRFYVTLSIDNGIFDVLDGNLAYPRMPEAFVQSKTEDSNESIKFNLNEIIEIANSIQ